VVEICVLAVFNSEHDVGDDKNALLEVAKKKTCFMNCINIIMWMLSDELAPGSQEAGNSWGLHVPKIT